MVERPLSPIRHELLTAVAQGRVRYKLPDWSVDGVVAKRWRGRSLREMRADRLIEVDDVAEASGVGGALVRLTGQGRRLLDGASD